MATEAAGVDMLSIDYAENLDDLREAAPSIFFNVAMPLTDFASADDIMRGAMDAMSRGADGIYYCGPLAWVEQLAKADIPVMGHAGLVPRKSLWIGGLRAFGKTIDEAKKIWGHVRDLENAGAYAVELEVVPTEVTRVISENTSLVTSSIGSGPHADVIYQFVQDILGETDPLPRHAKAYDDFADRYFTLQDARINAIKSFVAEVQAGEFPNTEHVVDDRYDVAADLSNFIERSRPV
ncbi:MAG: 3-methyl-2-oxobutanoate hydroxymethyltransferase [Alphaproteobacteria bacterium]